MGSVFLMQLHALLCIQQHPNHRVVLTSDMSVSLISMCTMGMVLKIFFVLLSVQDFYTFLFTLEELTSIDVMMRILRTNCFASSLVVKRRKEYFPAVVVIHLHMKVCSIPPWPKSHVFRNGDSPRNVSQITPAVETLSPDLVILSAGFGELIFI